MRSWTTIQAFAEWLLRASWQAAVLAVLVLLIQRVFGSRLTPAWRFRLWFVVIARLLLPVQIPSPSSVFNLARLPVPASVSSVRGTAVAPGTSASVAPLAGTERRVERSGVEVAISSIPPAAAVDLPPQRTTAATSVGGSTPTSGRREREAVGPRASAAGSVRSLWVAIWMAGAAFVLVRTVVQNLIFSRRLRRGSEPVSREVAEALDACRRALGVRFPVRARETTEVRSPAVYGFLRPMLLLPRGLASEFTAAELRFVLLHEMAHVKRRDAATTWLMACLQAFHWFNPILWFAFARMRVDRELACDALVLGAARDDEARGYGETILRLLEVLNRGSAMPGLVGILEDKEQIRERIRAIASFRRPGGTSAAAALLLAGLGWVGLTDAATSTKPLPPVAPLNLTNLLVAAENRSWQEEAVWKATPRGSNVFGGIEFRIDGLIQLSGTGPEGDGKKYRDRVIVPLVTTNGTGPDATVVRSGTNVGALHWVGATGYDAPAGTKIAEVVWRYADGTYKRTPVEYGVHLRDWWRAPYEEPARLPGPHTKVVWRGTHEDATRWGGKTLRLYRLSLANPEPKRVVRQLEFVSARARPATLILALTLDPLKPGERPDDTADLEMVDPDPTGRVRVSVVDGQGVPVEGATIRVTSRSKGQQGAGTAYPKSFSTDARGFAEVLHPGEGVVVLSLAVTKEDYASRKVVWDTQTGDVIPTAHTVRLGKSLTIGGTVVDPDGAPVAGAKVSLHRYWMGGEKLAT
ncbi:MAG: M48 family metalloprotease [Verrucomicrobiales bacterium]|nr:M48 family metalloprotease [Verrucomicrobiales bacterium]